MGTNYYGHATCMETCGMEKPCNNRYCSANPKYHQRKAAPMSMRASTVFTQTDESEAPAETGSNRERIFK